MFSSRVSNISQQANEAPCVSCCPIKLFPRTSFIDQLTAMLKVSFIRKYRAPTIALEIVLPLLFFVFVCLFAQRTHLWADALPNPQQDDYIPFNKVPGPSPQYGMIPDTPQTRALASAIEATSIALDSPHQITDSTIFFESFETYRNWISQNREIADTFYAIEWESNDSIRLSTNGLTGDSIADFVRTVTSAVLVVEKGIATPRVHFDYSALPSQKVFRIEHEEVKKLIIFATVLFIPPILTAAVNYGTEAESGLRDLFFFYGLSRSVNRLRWYLECCITSFLLSVPFAIAISAIIGISFWLLFIHFLLSTTSIVSVPFAIAICPTQAMGRVVGLGILMSFFVVFFWAMFSWLFTDDGYYEKRILSILPSASIPYTLGQIVSGHCINLNQAAFPDTYPVQMGFAYMAVETVVYYLLFVVIDLIKPTNWFRAVIHWGKGIPQPKVTPITATKLTKQYDDIRALNDVSFEIELGETLAIVGPNGAGKSTLLASLAGCCPTTSGEINFLGIDVTHDIEIAHRMMGYCPQDNLFMNELNAPEWLKTLSILRGVPDFDCSELFSALGLNGQLKGQIGEMSGGNKRKVCLASSLIGNPPIIILDEATSGVDFTSRTRIWSLISGLRDTTVIMGTHTLEECEKIADRIMVLVDGTISVLDTPTALRQLFKCGYLIETTESNSDALRSILKAHGIENAEIEITEDRATVAIPAGDHGALVGILRDIHFEYLMSVQNLEEQIFSHVQQHETQQLLRRDSEMQAEDTDEYPRV
jgi:ABC-type multidrug transport system ATPase subunit